MLGELTISVIIPIYNSSEYLEKCINSVLTQTYKNLDIILVDDGSTDGSAAICDCYAEKDSRISVIHKSNEGVSIARNTALQIAIGDFVGFVDADDQVLSNMFQYLLEQALEHQVDIVMCDTIVVYVDGKKEIDSISKLSSSKLLNSKDFSPELLIEMAGSACRCLYKRTLLQKYCIVFPEGVKFSEDRIFNLHAFGCANGILYLKEGYYLRFIREQSAVHRFHSDYYENIKKAAQATELIIRKVWCARQDILDIYLKHYIIGAIASISNYFYKTSTLSYVEKRNALRNICNDNDLRIAIGISKTGGFRARLILRKSLFMLEIAARLSNWKHHR